MEQNINEFINKLSTKSPTPGGGGVAALCGSMGAALASMVCELTIGKPKYKLFEDEVIEIAKAALILKDKLMALAEEDEVAFEPLSKAYSLPTDTDEQKVYKAEYMEKCLVAAADVPFRVVKTAYEAILLHERLVEKGSKLAISDVGVGAVVAKSALESAALNVYINTKFMANKTVADDYNTKTDEYVKKGSEIADKVYAAVSEMLR